VREMMVDRLRLIVVGGRSGKLLLHIVTLLLVAIGAGAFIYMMRNPREPSGQKDETPGRLVRVFVARKTSHRVAITAYGISRASEDWRAIAEVAGRAVEVSDRFEVGEILPAKTLIVKIDPTDHQLAVNSYEAEVRAQVEELRELDQAEANLKKILELQERQVKLASAEYERQQAVFDRNVATLSALESAENAYVTQLKAMQETENNLALMPVQRARLQAARDATKARLAQAKRDRDECEIRLPFRARCAAKSIEVRQYVSAGQELGRFLVLEKAEVEAMVETRKMRRLFPKGIRELGTLDLSQLSQEKSFFKRIQIPVDVSWGSGNLHCVWKGRFARIASSLDPTTRTIPVVVEVLDPYKDVQPGVRPPLIPGMFCKISAYGATLEDVIVIPRDALRDNRIYLLRDGKLQIVSVNVLALEEDLAVIPEEEGGVKEGDLVILTDLFPASEGMPLRSGRPVPNPVEPRTKIDFPEDFFNDRESPDERPANGRRPTGQTGVRAAGKQSADSPSPSLPAVEAVP